MGSFHHPPSKKHHSKPRNPFNHTLPQEVGKGHTSLFRSFQHPWQRASKGHGDALCSWRKSSTQKQDKAQWDVFFWDELWHAIGNNDQRSAQPSLIWCHKNCMPASGRSTQVKWVLFRWRICFFPSDIYFSSNSFHESLQNMLCLHLHRWRQIHPRDHVVEAAANLGRCRLSDFKIGQAPQMQPGNWP